jgi:DNA-binding NarL/FixJ family response regulator
VLKDAGPALLVEAVRAAHTGDVLISPQVTLRLLRHLAPVKAPVVAQPVVPLSEREIEVIRAIAKGRTNTEIAAELFISLSTVKTHPASVQNRLGVRNRVEIGAWAWESRLIQH